MGRLRRCVWLTAWAVWACLGVGLARQLPREIGAPVFKLTEGPGVECKPLGFLHGTHVFVAYNERDGETASLACWDADTGLKVREFGDIPSVNHIYGDWTSTSLRLGIAAVIRTEPAEQGDARSVLQLLDLRSGESRNLASLPLRPLAFHPQRSWIAASLPSDGERPTQVFVFDLNSLERLSDWTGQVSAHGMDHVRACHFIEDSNELLIVCDTFGEEPTGRVDQRLVHVDVPSDAVSTIVRLPKAYRTISPPAANGRMAMAGVNEPVDRTDIVDHRSGDVDHSVMASKASSSEVWPAILSPSGRTVMSAAGLHLLDGKPVWTPDLKFEEIVTRRDGKTFAVIEKWKPILKSVRLPYDWTTHAVRDLDDGRVLYRTWNRPEHEYVSSDGRVGVGDTLAVYALPPPINRPVLVACQAFLSFPLVLTWAVLGWTKRRRMRDARAVPAGA